MIQDRRFKGSYEADVLGIGSYKPGQRVTPRDEAHAAAMDDSGVFDLVPILPPVVTSEPDSTAEPKPEPVSETPSSEATKASESPPEPVKKSSRK